MPNDDLARARAESAALLNLDPDKLSPADALNCDLVSALRLVVDDELARATSGSGADLGKLIVAVEHLVGFLKEARPAEPEPAQHSVYTQDPHKFLEDLVDRWIAADEAEKAEQRAERIAQGLPAEPASETEALQMRIAELEAENERLRGVLPSPEARAITPTESEVIPPGEIPDLDANKAPGWQKQSWTGPEDGTLSWLRPVPKTRRIRLCGRFPYRPTIGGACGMYRPPISPVSAIERAIVCM